MRFTELALLSWEFAGKHSEQVPEALILQRKLFSLLPNLSLNAENNQHESHIWVDKLGTGRFNCQVNEWRQSRLYRALGPNHSFSTDTRTLRLRFLPVTQGWTSPQSAS